MPSVADNLRQIQAGVAAAASRAGRSPAGVTLLAASKTATPAALQELFRLGVRDFGENRVAEAGERLTALGTAGVNWHFIGHLQRNKAAAALAAGFLTIHSLESVRLVEVLGRECQRFGLKATVFLEVNVSGEVSKYGVTPEATEPLAEQVLATPTLRLAGLMTMAPYSSDPETARPIFRGLRQCRDRLEARLGVELPQLSMGMSGDYQVAVEEGSTLVRIGTALFQTDAPLA
ncbi:MAG: YggS family pyridoxal phosphate-dependent enzyme [Planctomycetota bacterium]|jgi:pyridoxal phosphate enzyme (YggS family)|nr:YggS family pyridoxal phosphate-dependent enzyme [Planctomycetota bacterium]